MKTYTLGENHYSKRKPVSKMTGKWTQEGNWVERKDEKRGEVLTMSPITYAIVHAAAWDEANRHMKRNGRTEWDESDWNVACGVFQILSGERREEDEIFRNQK